MDRVAIIVLNWNSADDSIHCVNSLLKQSILPDIIIVDNASADDSYRLLQEAFRDNPSVKVIENTENLGFSGGINTGIREAMNQKYTYIGVLNPDAIAEPKWCEKLLAEFLVPSTGIATGLMIDYEGIKIDSAGDFYTTWGLPFPRLRDRPKTDAPHEPEFVFGGTGGGALYDATMLQKIGYFDEKFFMYYEDVDLSFRAQLAGYKVRYTPHAVARHKRGVSSKKVPGLTVYNTFKNLPMLFWKNVPFALLPKIGSRFFILYTLLLFNAVRRGSGLPALRGFIKSWWLLPHTLSRRRHTMKMRTVSTNYLTTIIYSGIPPEQSGLRTFFTKFKVGR